MTAGLGGAGKTGNTAGLGGAGTNGFTGTIGSDLIASFGGK